jgi:hypothetical protein
LLFAFDIFLIIDKFVDLFLGYTSELNGEQREEKRLMPVILHNISPAFFLEIVSGLGPFVLNIYFSENHQFMKNTTYGLFKIYRYGRLLETD